MTPKQARALVAYIRRQREQLGLSARELARRAGVADVIRLEQGSLLNPRSSTLTAVADAPRGARRRFVRRRRLAPR